MKQYNLFFSNFILTSLALTFLVLVSGKSDYIHIYSLIAMFLSGVVIFLYYGKTGAMSGQTSGSNFLQINFEKHSSTAIIITVANALICILSVLFIASKIDFETISQSARTDVRIFFIISNVISVLIVQFGGWFLQAVLIYLVSLSFNIDLRFKSALIITGIAYSGFLLTSIFLLLYNFFTIEAGIPLEEFKEYVFSDVFRPITAKVGEYITLMLAAILLYDAIHKFSKLKALLVIMIPSIVILFFEQIFNYVF